MQTPRLLLAAALLLGPATVPRPLAAAQGPGPVLLEPHDFSSTGAWRRRAAAVRETRAGLLRMGDLRTLNAEGQALLAGASAVVVTGTFHVPVLPIAYNDTPVPYPVSEYQRILFSRAPGDRPYTLTTYYEEVSRGRVQMEGRVFDPVTADSNAAYYTDGCNGLTVNGFTTCPVRPVNRMGAMLIEILDRISTGAGADTIWSRYDNDGPDGVANSGDDDGTVDFVTFLQPEVGGECRSNTPPSQGIWSHRWVISVWNNGSPYVTRTLRRNAQGQPIPGQFIRVNDYTIQSEVGGITSCDGSRIMAVGTVSHETGHAFGLPDLYDTQGFTQGIGEWGLMGSGNYSRPYSPATYDAWSLHALGWLTLDTLSGSRVVTTGPRQLTDTVFMVPTNHPGEFVLLENRQAVLSDSAHMNPALPTTCSGFCPKTAGLLLWLINPLRVTLGLPTNTVNTGPLQGVELIQADGLNQLRTPGLRNRGDRGDSYPGTSGNARFSLLTNPSARNHDGQHAGFIIDRIEQLPAGVMRFRFTRGEPSVVRPAHAGAVVRVGTQTWAQYTEVLPPGDQIEIGVDSLQIVAAGRTRLGFLGWSNGGPQTQVLTAAERPDTLVAAFAVEHRVLVAVQGAGPAAVAGTLTGDLAQGIYAAEGTTVTLTATVPAGLLFAGWRGDTVAAAPTLRLTLRKGYDLEARFILAVTVATLDAVSELLGTPRLTPEQRGFLDELGNRNGGFDLGDLLAHFRRSGIATPPALRASSRPALAAVPEGGGRR